MRRYLKGNHNSGCPSLFVAFDTETREIPNPADPTCSVNPAWLVRAVRWRLERGKVRSREEFSTRAPRSFWAWVEQGTSARKRTWLFAHWLWYDLASTDFFRRIDSGAWRFAYRRRNPRRAGEQDDQAEERTGLCVLEDPPMILDLETCQGHRVSMVDLMNYWPRKLSTLGQWVGLPQLPRPGDEGTDQDWEARCKRDVEIVEACVNRLIGYVKKHDLGNLRYTAAGQSLALYRHRCMEKPITIGHSDNAKRDERQSYYGLVSRCHFWGRIEPDGTLYSAAGADVEPQSWHPQTPLVYRLDVNSCYPHVMWKWPYPVGYRETEYDPPVDYVERRLRDEECAADVTVGSPSRPYPRRVEGVVRWEVGKRRTWLAGPDLRLALAHEDVGAVHVIHWHRRAFPFGRWFGEVQALKRAAASGVDPLLADLVKSMSVALHGKLAQMLPAWQLLPGMQPGEPWSSGYEQLVPDGPLVRWMAIGEHVYARVGSTEHPENYPLMAAYVTAYARQHLAEAVRVAGRRQVPYQDADSIHVLREGYLRLQAAGWISADEPGKLRVDREARSAEWHGQKNYRLESEWVRAGVPERALVDPKGFYEITRVAGPKSSLNGGPPPGPVTDRVRVAMPAAKVEGEIGPDGWVEWPEVPG